MLEANETFGIYGVSMGIVRQYHFRPRATGGKLLALNAFPLMLDHCLRKD